MILQQSSFVAKQDDTQFGFLNIDIKGDQALVGTFYADEKDPNVSPGVST